MTIGPIETRGLYKQYAGHEALSDVSLSVMPGEHTAIIGPSGGGKSTLLRLLGGLDAPSNGTILLHGQTVSEANEIILPPHRRGLAMVFQDLALWPNLSVLANVELGLSGQRLSKRQRTARAQEALQLSGVSELSSRKPGQISGGQQQRVALARAIAVRPAYLLLDEPFAGVDLAEKVRLIGEIATLANNHQITVVMVSHDPVEAAAICQQAIVLDRGRVCETGPLSRLLAESSAGIFEAFRKLHRGSPIMGNPS